MSEFKGEWGENQVLVIDDNQETVDHLAGLVGEIDLKLTGSAKALHTLLKAAKQNKFFPVLMVNCQLGDSFIQDIVSRVRSARTYRWPSVILYSSANQQAPATMTEVADHISLTDDNTQLLQLIDNAYGRYLAQHLKIRQQFEKVVPKILLVEDDEINQKIASIMLKNINCEYEICSTGKEALKKIDENHYDLLLLDLGLPDIDGYEVTQKIRKREKGGQHLSIVAITAFISDTDLNKCFAAGMDDIVIKPVSRDNLERTIASNLVLSQ